MDNVSKDIAALNLRCLLLIRDLARDSVTLAVDVFGVSADVARTISRMSVDEVHVFAETATLMYRPMFDRKTLELLVQVPADVRGAIMEVRHGSGK